MDHPPVTVSPAEPNDGAQLAHLLLGLLERRQLSDIDLSVLQLTPFPVDQIRPMLSEVTGLGAVTGEDANPISMSTALTASHRGHAVVLGVLGTREHSRVFFGARRLEGTTPGSTAAFLDAQSSLLRMHAPGLELSSAPEALGGELHRFIQDQASAFALVTGIPSAREERDWPRLHTLDQLINAVKARRYAIMVVAEPVEQAELDRTLDACRQLRAQFHTMARRNVSFNRQTGTSRQTGTNTPDPKSSLVNALAYASMVIGPLVGGALAGPAGAKGAAVGSAWLAAAVAALDVRALSQAPGSANESVTEQTSDTLIVGADLIDAAAQAYEELLDQHIDRLKSARGIGWWRTSVAVCADSEATLEVVTSALRGTGTGDTTPLDPLRVLPVRDAVARPAMLRGQTLLAGPAGRQLDPSADALATYMTSEELAVLVNVPQRDVPGIPRRDVAEFALSAPEPPAAEKSIPLGHIIDVQGQAVQPLAITQATLNRHVLISGMTGFGKTTTAKRLLLGARGIAKVPFLVIEPAKAEYRLLAGDKSLSGVLRVYGIGADSPLPLRLNPFEPVQGTPLGRHIDLIKEVFNSAFPMYGPMASLLEEAMIEAYTERGWDIHTSRNHVLDGLPDDSPPDDDDRVALLPTLADVHEKIESIVRRHGYAGEMNDNMRAALRARLKGLMIGSKGLALNTRRSTPAHELFARPAVIELRDLGMDEEKSFVMALLLCQLSEYAEARLDGQPSHGRLRHLTLIEEAHRLLRAAPPPSNQEIAQSASLGVTKFTDMLAELRAYGEGFLICDQIPTKLAVDTLKNTDVKITHHLPAADDKHAIATATNLTETQSRHLSNLGVGEAVVQDQEIGSSVHITVTNLERPGPLVFATVGSDQYLRRNGGCRRCQSPCEQLTATERVSDSTDRALSQFFADFRYAPAAAWSSWSRWRPDAGERDRAYCAFTQAAVRWLAQALPDTPDRLLRQDQAARQFAELAAGWLDKGQDADISGPRNKILKLINGQPPEYHGCATCPARCQMLSLITPMLTVFRQVAAPHATENGAADARLSLITRKADEHFNAAKIPVGVRDSALYCLITNAVGSGTALTSDKQLNAEGVAALLRQRTISASGFQTVQTASAIPPRAVGTSQ